MACASSGSECHLSLLPQRRRHSPSPSAQSPQSPGARGCVGREGHARGGPHRTPGTARGHSLRPALQMPRLPTAHLRSQEPPQRPPRPPRPLLFPHPAAAVSPSLTLPTASDPLGGRHRCPRAGGCLCRSRAPRAPLCQLSAVSRRCGFPPRRFSRPLALCDTLVHSAQPVCPAAAPGARGPASGAACPT